MTLDDLEKLDKARTPGPWGTDAHYVIGKVDENIYAIIADTFSTQTGRESANAAFIAACSDMVPRMIKALKAANALHMRFVHDETNTVKDSLTFLRLSKTLAELVDSKNSGATEGHKAK